MKRYIDLTHKLHNEITVFPGDKQPDIKELINVNEHGAKVTFIGIGSHMGTHMDAPSHMCEGVKNLDDFDIDFFFGKAYVIDCSKQETITKKSLLNHTDKIKKADFILFFTGKQNEWGKETYTQNLTVMDKECAKWLNQFDIRGIGTDGISHDRIDANPSKEETYVHHIFFSSEKVLIENLNNLDKIVNHIVDFVCLPLYYKNSDGAPVRAVAYY
jgi:arylformamidase